MSVSQRRETRLAHEDAKFAEQSGHYMYYL